MSVVNGVVCTSGDPLIPSHLSFSRYFKDALERGKDDIALVAALTDEKITYRDILEKSISLALSLKDEGVKKGDVVCVCSENRFEYMITVIGAIFAGAIVSTANMLYTEDEIAHILNIAKPKYVFASPLAIKDHLRSFQKFQTIQKIFQYGREMLPNGILAYQDLVNKHPNPNTEEYEPVESKGADDVVAILYSSGTTGLPKGVMLSHLNMLTAANSFVNSEIDQTEATALKRILTIVPWFHAYGFLSTLFILSANKMLVCLPRFKDREYLDTIQKYKTDLLLAVPPIVVFLAKSPLVDEYDVSSVLEIWSGAAPLSEEVINATLKRFKNIRSITQAYGMTETTLAVLRDHNRTSALKPGSVGSPKVGVRVKVVDLESRKPLGPYEQGEICVKGTVVMKGYVGDATTTLKCFDEEGYFVTGDVGYYDSEGCFYIVDRVKDLIKYKGFQVAPAEVESVLLEHPAVLECGVVGKPDEEAGELPTAFVVKRPGADVAEKDIIEFVASKLSRTKHLTGGIIFMNEIPKNPSGKILRKELKKQFKPKASSKL